MEAGKPLGQDCVYITTLCAVAFCNTTPHAVELARNRSAFLRNPCVIYGGGVAAYAKRRQSHKEVVIMHIRSPDKD